MTDAPHQLTIQILDDEETEQPVLVGVYPDRGRATAAAMAAVERIKPGALSRRFVVSPVGQGDLAFGDHEILVASARPDPEKVRKRADRLVDVFDDRWATLTSLPHHMRLDARQELITAIVVEIMVNG